MNNLLVINFIRTRPESSMINYQPITEGSVSTIRALGI